ncbi:MAG: hypothetical protein QF921_08990 [Pseudomonadales bacterium]|jgi:hypothetical protein|nr:hypothetical protein [Pseudomonadales bacterium]MDP6471153.1 hypothetical protein [Pseudomonadales bacterium]MDP6825660.1 hypothetical protein [Pseudomonadales bacterium]MDP6971629.1 hypothetical protein [Pseudomonadales bacterium]|tara:strand:+ start:1441 stop:1818 length:378 start_codon:yes stop_codon:yes gene_type:complete
MSAEQASAAVQAFIDAFNAQDHVALASSLNYPHVRLARGRFVTIESAGEFAERSRSIEPRLAEEGWHHTVVRALKVLHAGADKVHIALGIDRCREDGEVYNQFDTLWIATLMDGHWGIQFRSSYL